MTNETTSLRDTIDEEPVASFILLGLIILDLLVSVGCGLVTALCYHYLGGSEGHDLPIGFFEKTVFLLFSYQGAFWLAAVATTAICILYFRFRLKKRLLEDFKCSSPKVP